MKKIKSFFESGFGKRLLAVIMCGVLLSLTAVVCFAEGESGTVPEFQVSDVQSVLTPVTQQFTFAKIAQILAIVVGAAAVLTLGWFGVRKVISVIQRALKKGRVSV